MDWSTAFDLFNYALAHKVESEIVLVTRGGAERLALKIGDRYCTELRDALDELHGGPVALHAGTGAVMSPALNG